MYMYIYVYIYIYIFIYVIDSLIRFCLKGFDLVLCKGIGGCVPPISPKRGVRR